MYANYENSGVLYDKNLTTIIFFPPGINTDTDIPFGLTSIGDYAFYENKVNGVPLPPYIVSIGTYTFSYCNNLEIVTLNSNLETIDSYAFAYCSNLRTIEITDSVTLINNYAFYDCYNLENVILGENLKTIGDYAFSSCTTLKNITIPASVTTISPTAFRSSEKLQFINVSSNNQMYSNLENSGVLYDKNISTIIIYPEGILNNTFQILNSVTLIEGFIFTDNNYLKSIILGNNVEIIDDYAFYNCKYLEKIILGEKLKTIGDSAFESCIYLTNITIPSSVILISPTAFLLCRNLQIINISPDNQIYSNYNNDGILYNKNISEIIIYPEGISNKIFQIPKSVTSIGNYAFALNLNLLNIVIGEYVKSIGSYAFAYCYSLQYIYIPNSVITIGEYAFYSLIYYPEIVTPTSSNMNNLIETSSNKYISNLNTVIIGENVKEIGRSAFMNCFNLNCIYFYGTCEPNIEENAFFNVYLSNVMTSDLYIEEHFDIFNVSNSIIDECLPFIFTNTFSQSNTYSQSNSFTSSFPPDATLTHSFLLTYTISLTQTVTLYNSYISNTISNSNGIFTYTEFIYYEYKVIIFSEFISFYSDFFTIFYQNDFREQLNNNNNDIIIGVCVAIAIVVVVSIVIAILILVWKKKQNIEKIDIVTDEENKDSTNVFAAGTKMENIKEDPFADDFKEEDNFINI